MEKAMQVFWTKGFEATSVDDLVDTMGLSRSSFYNTFGSKHELFLVAIEHYNRTATETLVARLESGTPAREVISQIFSDIVAAVVSGEDKRGCFLGNSAIEVGPRDVGARSRVAGGFARVEDAFYALIVRGQRSGEISTCRDARALARYMISSINGLRLIAKANPDGEMLNDVVQITLSVLD